MVEMNIKNPNFLKQLPKEARKEAFKWAFYEERILSIKLSFHFLKRELISRLSSKKRNSYRVKGEMDFKSKLFGYSLATSTKWIGFGSEFTAEVKADPGNLVPHKLTGELYSFLA